MDKMTNACENITFPQLLLRTVISYVINITVHTITRKIITVNQIIFVFVKFVSK